ncbi:delta-1-pyrroline-5-carboxylate dehydrogenase 1 [Aureobasidium sp. EXF-8845]|nr:delta-1-pyrroline-5-carboxylate dehydrogenase 1 [Aureobasidium sp. EXF-8845]KAI4857566.1 delta-1-pyrroline-5-carboxylate dehydrogenase 1 [Aureobasidium sp. EXF-8846]
MQSSFAQRSLARALGGGKRGSLVIARSVSTAYKIPKPFNEPNLHYDKASPEREKMLAALAKLRKQLPVSVPAVRHGIEIASKDELKTVMPSETASVFAQYSPYSKADVAETIKAALETKKTWQETSFHDRAAIFLRAAELVSTTYRFELIAATMLGQGKNAWQAEIDAAAELADFYRFNVGFAEEIYLRQPTLNASGQTGHTDWRPLKGFVYAVSLFNFTAIGGNLISGPALMGNVVLWKPSPGNIYASYLVHKILLEAGLPPNVIRLVNGDAELVTDIIYDHPEFAALQLHWLFRCVPAAAGVRTKKYRDYPRMVAETSGKNFHLIHYTADIPNAVRHTIRAAFEYAGQKCSACSRIYVPESRAAEFWSEMKANLSLVKVGAPEDFGNFTGPVINHAAFKKITDIMDDANKDDRLEKIHGGTYDGTTGLYIEPTIYAAKTLDHELFDREIFGPVLTAYVYPDAEYDSLLTKIDQQGGGFALTGAIFATD